MEGQRQDNAFDRLASLPACVTDANHPEAVLLLGLPAVDADIVLPTAICAAVEPPLPTRRELAWLFLWLLGGDFALTFFEQIFARFIPIFADNLHASNTLIGLMTGSLAGAVNLFVLPLVSVRSDRCRGRWGRRIPFLLWATPATVVSLLLVGFAPEIGSGLAPRLSALLPVTPMALTLGLLCVSAVSYHLWNMVLVNAYTWLIRDVVPTVFVGRFLSWFRVVGTVASFLFLWEVFPSILDHRQEVFVAVGVLYAVVFLLMCWRIKEGEHPPPPVVTAGLFKTYGRYFRECLSLPIYRRYFAASVLMVAALSTTGPFVTLFARNQLGLSMEELGKPFAAGTLVGAFILPFAGWVCDRFKAIRVAIVGIALYAVMMGLACVLVRGRVEWWTYNIVAALPASLWALGSAALNMELFPAKQFGQFSAGLNVFGFGSLTIGNYLVGRFMDFVHSDYRMAFVWSAATCALAVIPMLMVYKSWQEHGGPDHYVPPLPLGSQF